MKYLCASPNKEYWIGYFYLNNDMTLLAIKKKLMNLGIIQKQKEQCKIIELNVDLILMKNLKNLANIQVKEHEQI